MCEDMVHVVGKGQGRSKTDMMPRSGHLLTARQRIRLGPLGNREPLKVLEGGEDGKPESNQDGNGQAEGDNRDAVARGVDDLHCREVRFLGRGETKVSAFGEGEAR